MRNTMDGIFLGTGDCRQRSGATEPDLPGPVTRRGMNILRLYGCGGDLRNGVKNHLNLFVRCEHAETESNGTTQFRGA